MKFLFPILLAAFPAWSDTSLISLRTVPSQATLKGAAATQQFLAIAKYSDGTEGDVTAEVEWKLSAPTLAKLISPGRIAPSANGTIIVTAVAGGKQSQSSVRIQEADVRHPVSFLREVEGILTRSG